jgi:broad specificity phosphatase PhoE
MLGDVGEFARLVLLRHPELDATALAQALGQQPAELSRRGRASVLQLLRDLAAIPIDGVVSSDRPQAAVVAASLAQDKGLAATQDPRLRDQSLGDWEGKAWEDLQQSDPALLKDFFGDFGLIAPPGGESLAQAVERMLEWWNEIADEAIGKTLLVVANTPILTAFAASLIGLSVRRSLALTMPPSAFGILDAYRDGAALRTWHPHALSDDRA